MVPLHCMICQSLLLPPAGEQGFGISCTDCGLAACDQPDCLKTAQRKHHCKNIALHRPGDKNTKRELKNDENTPKHHWVPGNLPLLAECDVCETPCSESPAESLRDLKCCWCHRYLFITKHLSFCAILKHSSLSISEQSIRIVYQA